MNLLANVTAFISQLDDKFCHGSARRSAPL
jgi:hypothetical protein